MAKDEVLVGLIYLVISAMIAFISYMAGYERRGKDEKKSRRQNRSS